MNLRTLTFGGRLVLSLIASAVCLVLNVALESRQVRVQTSDVFVDQLVRLQCQLYLIVTVLFGLVEQLLDIFELALLLTLFGALFVLHQGLHELIARIVNALHQRLGTRVQFTHQVEIALQFMWQMLKA